MAIEAILCQQKNIGMFLCHIYIILWSLVKFQVVWGFLEPYLEKGLIILQKVILCNTTLKNHTDAESRPKLV
jgi:hypothetical protein